MSEHPIEGMLGNTMDKIKEMVDVNTVIGTPITTPDGTTVIPVSKVAYGFASGGADLPAKSLPNKDLFGGGSGAGITITPIAFLAITDGNVSLLQVEPFNTSTDRVISMVPEVVDKVNSLIKKSGERKAAKKAAKEEEQAASKPVAKEDVKLDDPCI